MKNDEITQEALPQALSLSPGHPERKCEPIFASWAETIQNEVEIIQGLLAEALSDNPAQLVAQLTSLEAWNGRMVVIEADAHSFLDLAEHKAIMEIDRELTVLEREKILRATVTSERRIRDIVSGLRRVMENRISLGQSLLRALAGERVGHQT